MKNILTCILICIVMTQLQTANAQSSNTSNTKPSLSLNHLAIHVYDLKTSADFYEHVMGFKRIPEPFKDGLHDWFSIGDPYQLHIIQGAPKEIFQDRRRHFCFSVASINDFITHLGQHKVAHYNSKGVLNTITVRPDGVKQIYIQDPDGYWIEVNNEVL